MKMGIRVAGLKNLLHEFRKLDPAIKNEVRIASKKIAEDEVPRLKAAAARSDKLSAAVGVTIRARSERVPMVVVGGAKKLSIGSKGAQGRNALGQFTKRADNRPRAGDVFFGAEFGGGMRKSTKQFRPHRGTQGYWMWPQLREDEMFMIQDWLDAIDRALDGQKAGL